MQAIWGGGTVEAIRAARCRPSGAARWRPSGGGTVEAIEGGTVHRGHRGRHGEAIGTVEAIWGGTVQAIWGGTVQAIEGGTVPSRADINPRWVELGARAKAYYATKDKATERASDRPSGSTWHPRGSGSPHGGGCREADSDQGVPRLRVDQGVHLAPTVQPPTPEELAREAAIIAQLKATGYRIQTETVDDGKPIALPRRVIHRSPCSSRSGRRSKAAAKRRRLANPDEAAWMAGYVITSTTTDHLFFIGGADGVLGVCHRP